MSSTPAGPQPDPQTRRWWRLLKVASVGQCLACIGLLFAVAPRDSAQAYQLALAAIYTAVCAFRSFYPRVDLERTVMVDHPLSSIVLGRSAATLAEVAFAVQLALFAHRLAADVGSAWMALVSVGLVPLIATAQVCCWLGVLTLNHRWHAAEEALWGVMVISLGTGLALSASSLSASWQILCLFGVLSCATAAWVMLIVDVPMYLARARQGDLSGVGLLSVGEGFRDALSRRHPRGDWETWRHEVTWMTPYFTGGVWISMGLAWL